MQKKDLPPCSSLYPVPVALVTCCDKKSGKANIITIAWCGVVCSEPPQLSISIRPSRYSHELIRQSGEFVINIPTKRIVRAVDLCGLRSGKDSDKIRMASLTSLPASKVSAPMIEECPVNIECVLKKTIALGTHDMFIGEVAAVHADDSILDKNGAIDFKKAEPIVYNQGEYWALGEKIGHHGFSAR